MGSPIKIFFCYAREDQALRDGLDKHLGALKRSDKIITWHDREIAPGKDWMQEIHRHMEDAEIILLLVSPDFLTSDYCYGIEMKRALERSKSGEVSILPIIIRPVFWIGTPIEQFQALPTDARAVTKWTDIDEAFEDVVQGIFVVVKARLEQQMDVKGDLKLVSGSKESKDVTCPYCGDIYPETITYCQKCGYQFHFPASQ